MEAYLNAIRGVDDAIVALHESKRSLSREFEMEIRDEVALCTRRNGFFCTETKTDKFDNWVGKVVKWGTKHVTLLEFIDLSFTVYGLHRGGQDDIDSHAKAMDNRIVRASTRLADFKPGEMSDYYKGKIMPTDAVLESLGINLPDEITIDGKRWVRATNGYILKGLENENDVKRGLYMLSIPSTFNFNVNLMEFAHIYQQRRKEGTANPEVKETVESLVDQLEEATCGIINRGVLLDIRR